MDSEALRRHIRRHVAASLAEDIGSGDVTAALLPEGGSVKARIVCREAAILCGRPWAEEVFQQLDPDIIITWHFADGGAMTPGAEICQLEGPAPALLTGERTALNYLQCLSATATLARQFSDAVAGTGCRILDTRKTLPGLRLAQKYATRCGGCTNHRTGLYDGILIKENHIMAAGSVAAAVAAARQLDSGLDVEIEVEDLAELDQALAAGADIVMLDNFSIADMAEAVRRNQGRARLEASGNMTLEVVRAVAETGVDYISVGALTKHVRAVDLSMRVETAPV